MEVVQQQGAISKPSNGALPDGFVYLEDVDPTIQHSLRYRTAENFTGSPLPGYHTSRVVVTAVLAEKLARIQSEVRPDGLCLVIYDTYRPQKAIQTFWNWAQDAAELSMADKYYPTFADRKEVLFKQSYVALKSNHNRGSTVDLTFIREGDVLRKEEMLPLLSRRLSDGEPTVVGSGEGLPFLDDGTVDMGTSWDFLDTASHPDAPLDVIPQKYRDRRDKLRLLMESHGFRVSPREWWHYWLVDEEPFPPSDNPPFDFDI